MEIKKTHLNIEYKYICEKCDFYSNNKMIFNDIFPQQNIKRVFGNNFEFWK